MQAQVDLYDSASQPAAARRWFAFLGGGISWTAHLLSLYAISEFGCVSGTDEITMLGISLVAWMLMVVSAVLLAVAVASMLVGHADAKRDEGRGEADGEETAGGRYLSHVGRIFGALFSLIIAIESVPIFFYLDGC